MLYLFKKNCSLVHFVNITLKHCSNSKATEPWGRGGGVRLLWGNSLPSPESAWIQHYRPTTAGIRTTKQIIYENKMNTCKKIFLSCIVGLNQRICTTSGPVSTWMGDRPRAGNPSRYVASRLGQLSLPSLHCRQIEYQPSGRG